MVRQDDRPPTCCSQRWIIAYMGTWLGFMSYLLSMNMSVAVVCMVKQEVAHTKDTMVSYLDNGSSIFNTTTIHDVSEFNASRQLHNMMHHVSNNITMLSHGYMNENASPMPIHQTGEFTWTKQEQSFILSGYFYSYGLAQIPGGWLGAKYGGRRVIGISMTVACLMTLFTPLMARSSIYLVVVVRIILGMSLGTVVPSFFGLVGVWALPTERSRMLGILYLGQRFGAVVAYSTSGILCVHGFDNGWASVFYLHGIVGVVFVGFWWYFVYNSPNEHPRITVAEKMIIRNDLKDSNNHKKKPPIPWKKILTHLPLYISYLGQVCDTWTLYLLLTSLPQYMKVLQFDIQSNGLISCLPLVTNIIGLGSTGAAADYVRMKTKLTVTSIRKLFLISGFVGVGCFMLIPGFLTSENRYFAIVCICVCMVFESVESVGGYSPNSVDIAPRYASIIFGISNTFGSIPGAVAPLMVAIITKNQTVEEWQIVFFITTGVSVIACIVYGIFANNEPVKWGDIHDDVELEVDLPINSVQSTNFKSDMDI